ncbi:MAG: tetratricopeptide repeat-containing sensor histidine kinase [Bacteroidales bacterium]
MLKLIESAGGKEERVIYWLELSKYYQQKSYNQAKKAILNARSLALELNNASLMANTYLMEAQIHFIGYVGDSARILLERSLEYADKAEDYKTKAYALTWLAMYYVNTSDRGEFLRHLDAADQIFRTIGDEEGHLFIISTLARQLSAVGLSGEAFNVLRNAPDLSKEKRYLPFIISIRQQLAEAYSADGKKDSAELILQQLLPLAKAGNQKSLEASILRQMASIAISQKKFNQAIEYLNRAYENTSALQLHRSSADILTMLANVYYETGNSDLSILLNHKVRELRDKLKFPGIIINTMTNLGALFLQNNNPDSAIYWFEKGLQKANEIGSNRAINIIGTYLSRTYENKGDFQHAYKYFALKAEAERKINQIIANNGAIALYSRLEEEKMKRALEENRARYKTNTFFLYGVLLLFLFIFILLVFFWQRARIILKEKRSKVKEELLRYQMNPHFIFNALIAIQSFIYQKKSLEAVQFLEHFSSLIRLLLVSSQSDFVCVSEDIEVLSKYLKIQKLRFEDKFDFLIECDPSINMNETAIPPLLTQPFVENSIEHGFSGIEGKGFIHVKYTLSGEMLVVTIADNGKGIENARNDRSHQKNGHMSLGINITRERIEILNHELKGKPIKFSISDNRYPGAVYPGTRVEFSIPLIKLKMP